MGLATTNADAYVVATGTGASDYISLRSGVDFVLSFRSAGAFVLDVQIGDGTTFKDIYEGTTKQEIDSSTGQQDIRVTGGQKYRMDVGTYNNPITMTAREA